MCQCGGWHIEGGGDGGDGGGDGDSDSGDGDDYGGGGDGGSVWCWDVMSHGCQEKYIKYKKQQTNLPNFISDQNLIGISGGSVKTSVA